MKSAIKRFKVFSNRGGRGRKLFLRWGGKTTWAGKNFESQEKQASDIKKKKRKKKITELPTREKNRSLGPDEREENCALIEAREQAKENA